MHKRFFCFAALVLALSSSACSEQSFGRMLENVLPGQSLEQSAGRALDSGNSAVEETVQPTDTKIWGSEKKKR